MKIIGRKLGFQRERLKQAFGFKGGSLSELWQIVCRLELENGLTGTGVGVQSILWSEPDIFAGHTETGGNLLMASLTEKALNELEGKEFTSPSRITEELYEELYDYAAAVTGRPGLSRTFIWNALVPVDFALWQLQAKLHGQNTFEELIRESAPSLRGRQESLGQIPLISYQVSEEGIRKILGSGDFLLKIKIGANAGRSDDYQGMLELDIRRLEQIHRIAADYETPHTDCGRPVYYLDANGRYDNLERMQRFLDAADRMGALDRIILLEEPFADGVKLKVDSLPVRVAADESIHERKDVTQYIEELGYGAITLKPIAKTLSGTLLMFEEAFQHGTPCFCADLTVPPVMLEWNMNVAARLPTLPGLKTGVIESNGFQNYRDWDKLRKGHPLPAAPWLNPQNGIYRLDRGFYERFAGVLPAPEYEKIVEGEG